LSLLPSIPFTGVKIDVEVTSSGAPASPPKRLQRYAAKTKSTDLTSVQRRLSRAESLKEEETAAKVAFAATQNLQAEERALKAKAQADVVRPAVQRRQTEQRLRKAEERKAEAIQQKTKFSRSDSLKVVETQAKNLIADAIGGKNAAALEARARTADERKAEAEARKVAFARSDSLKGEKARVVSEMTQHCRTQIKGQENTQRVANASVRKSDALAQKTAFAKADAAKVAAGQHVKGGGWVDLTLDTAKLPDAKVGARPGEQRAFDASASPVVGLGASMTWGAAKAQSKK